MFHKNEEECVWWNEDNIYRNVLRVCAVLFLLVKQKQQVCHLLFFLVLYSLSTYIRSTTGLRKPTCMVFLSHDNRDTWLVMASIFRGQLTVFRHYFICHLVWSLIWIVGHLFGCLFLLPDTRLQFRWSRTFESLRNWTAQNALLFCSSLPLRLSELFRHDDMYSALFLSDFWVFTTISTGRN